MRFHQFKSADAPGGEVHINLDAVNLVEVSYKRRRSTVLYVGGLSYRVDVSPEEVLALVSPPAAPDTYEEDLAAKSRKAFIDRMRAKVDDMRRFTEPEPMQDTADLELPPVSVAVSEALAQGERRCRLDELERLQATVNRVFYGLLHGAGLERRFNAIIEARRAVLEA